MSGRRRMVGVVYGHTTGGMLVVCAIPHESPRRRACFCLGMLMQRCPNCDPDGTMYANVVVRPELAPRCIG